MNVRRVVLVGALSLAFGATTAWALDKAAKQAEVLKATQGTLDKFYEKKPELKAVVAKAPGYGVFSTFGISFLIGGSGGTGVVHDNKTKKNTFMKMGAGSVGGQIGAAETEILVVFKTAAAMHEFVDKGWTAGGSATAGAGAGSSSAGGGVGSSMMENADTYTITKAGLEAGLSVGGSKFWKDKDLN
jgi:lipid-binding SYLF domain-containing protein